MEQEKLYQEKLASLTAQEIMQWAFDEFSNKVALASSLGVEDQLLSYMAIKVNKNFRIFTLDTGRVFQESYDVMDSTSMKYNFSYEVCFPDAADVEKLVSTKGPNSFYDSIENRKECCFIRKIKPLQKKLASCKAWVTGLRQSQSITREHVPLIEWDKTFNLWKINPLALWQEEEVWNLIKEHKVPYNKLQDNNFPSVGCRPCTREIEEGEDIRAGRWWWESFDSRECGLHKK